MQRSSNFELVKSENFEKYLLAKGTPEAYAKGADNRKSTLKICQDGDNVKITNVEDGQTIGMELVIGKEVDEVYPYATLKSTTVLEDDTLTITSKDSTGKITRRSYKFGGNGVVLTIQDEDAAIPVATRSYKKV